MGKMKSLFKKKYSILKLWIRFSGIKYYQKRRAALVRYIGDTNNKFYIFESRNGYVGQRMWDLWGAKYMVYSLRIRPRLRRKIFWYEKQIAILSLKWE